MRQCFGVVAPMFSRVSRLVSGGVLVVGVVAGMGCNKKAAGTSSVTSEGGPVAITAGEDGFSPSSVKLKKGAHTTLVFTRTTDQTCATEVVFPELNVRKDLPKGMPVTIPVPTDKEQTLTFQCGMGMYKSSVVISAQ